MRRILLKKMFTPDRVFFLIAPGAAEIEQASGEDSAWVTDDKQFRNVVRRHPVTVVFDDLRRMLRCAIDWDLARELESWAPVFTGPQIRPPVDRHFGFGKRAQDSGRKELLDEDVVLQHQFLAFGRTQALEEAAR